MPRPDQQEPIERKIPLLLPHSFHVRFELMLQREIPWSAHFCEHDRLCGGGHTPAEALEQLMIALEREAAYAAQRHLDDIAKIKPEPFPFPNVPR